jgi:D-threo-aldose 1-dehydrogenase
VSCHPSAWGTAQLGNLLRAISDEEGASTVDAAGTAGIRYFDTAPHYGLGFSERRLGAALAGIRVRITWCRRRSGAALS